MGPATRPRRLIDVRTCHLADPRAIERELRAPDHLGRDLPYGIVSHRWTTEEDEVRFRDLSEPQSTWPAVGRNKLRWACRLAKEDNIPFVWLDTCCIDTGRSGELDECMENMFQWYQNALCCYAYLGDTDINPRRHRPLEDDSWFRRGWTLQELIAPHPMKFYDRRWRLLGFKTELAGRISDITRIDPTVLCAQAHHHRRLSLAGVSAARIMSWAARRETTEPEDRAYSLMGLFGVSMEVRYGEGAVESFLRLQKEIARKRADFSILAWSGILPGGACGLLAPSPDSFSESAQVAGARRDLQPAGLSLLSFDKRERCLISATVQLRMLALDTYAALLPCEVGVADQHERGGASSTSRLVIYLRKVSGRGSRFARVRHSGRDCLEEETSGYRNNITRAVTVRVCQESDPPASPVGSNCRRILGFRISQGVEVTRILDDADAYHWDRAEGLLEFRDPEAAVAGVLLELSCADMVWPKAPLVCWVVLAFDFSFRPVVVLACESPGSREAKQRLEEIRSRQFQGETYRGFWKQPRDHESSSNRAPYYLGDTDRGLWKMLSRWESDLDVQMPLAAETSLRLKLTKPEAPTGEVCWHFNLNRGFDGLVMARGVDDGPVPRLDGAGHHRRSIRDRETPPVVHEGYLDVFPQNQRNTRPEHGAPRDWRRPRAGDRSPRDQGHPRDGYEYSRSPVAGQRDDEEPGGSRVYPYFANATIYVNTGR